MKPVYALSKIFLPTVLLWIIHVVVCLLCFCARLFIVALWSPADKGLTYWLLFVMSTCGCVAFT